MAVQDDDIIAPALDPQAEESCKEKTRKRTLGNLRLVHPETNAVILVPTPSSDPNDPLNWSTWRKYYVAGVLCLAMAVCNFLAAGPAIAVPATAADFFPDSLLDGTFTTSAIPKTAYFFTTTSLLIGLGNIIWVPAANKWGRRPVYILSYAIYFATAVWLIYEKSYARFLAGRVLMGFGSGAAETLAPITIADVFFLHERGRVMSAYTCFLSVGASGGLVISGLITVNHTWRTIYQVGAALVGFVLLALLLTVPETSYSRTNDDASLALEVADDAATTSTTQEGQSFVKKMSYVESLFVFKAAGTSENLFKMMVRPFGLIILPPVLWSALALSVTIGFLVAVSSNSASAFNVTYGFASWQVGLCYISGVIGALLGLPAGGYLGDKVADILTKRNDGIREPEMRLPAVMVSVITMPLSLVLYGVGIQYQLHWICPTLGLGLRKNQAPTSHSASRILSAHRHQLTHETQSTSPSRRPTQSASCTSLIHTGPLRARSRWQSPASKPSSPFSYPLKRTLGSMPPAIRTVSEPWRELRGPFSSCGSRCISGESKSGITRGNGESFPLSTGTMIARWESNDY